MAVVLCLKIAFDPLLWLKGNCKGLEKMSSRRIGWGPLQDPDYIYDFFSQTNISIYSISTLAHVYLFIFIFFIK